MYNLEATNKVQDGSNQFATLQNITSSSSNSSEVAQSFKFRVSVRVYGCLRFGVQGLGNKM